MRSGECTCLASVLLVIAMSLIIQGVASPALGFSAQGSDPAPVARNIVLFFDDYPTRGDPQYQITKEIVKPLLAHVDENGNATDFMFDSFVFFSLFLSAAKTPTRDYVVSWISYLFNGSQIANLDATVADVKVALNRPDYRLNVFLTVPVVYTPPPFSSTMVPDTVMNVNTLLAAWNQLNPQNLRLVGFCWGFTEDLSSNVGTVIAPVASYVHSKGYKLLMIPDRGASNSNYHGLGVDYVTAQVNYMVDPTSNITDFDIVNKAIAAGHADGAEIEIPTSVQCCNGDWQVNLQTYFQQAYQHEWYRNNVTTYYYGPAISEMGTNPAYRTAYENIYSYIQAVRNSFRTTTTTSASSQTSTTRTTSSSSALMNFELSASPNTLNMPQASSDKIFVIVQSIGAFSDAVSLQASSLPDGVQVSFSPNPVTPQAGIWVESTATVEVLGSVPTGTYSFKISAMSGSLSRQIDIIVNVSSCLIATATYGSELSPEVQFLRDFRDRQILNTFAGSNFMTVFNAWYYSFSPSVAQYISTHETARSVMKGVLYPLMEILYLSSLVYSALAFLPELAGLTSGIIVSSLIGLVYLTPPLSAILWFVPRRVNKGIQQRFTRWFAGLFLSLISTFMIAEGLALSVAMMIVSASIVLSVLIGTGTLMALWLVEAAKHRLG